jgi:hypothetical protein
LVPGHNEKKNLLGNSCKEIAYVQNKSSKNARKVLDRSEHLEIEIWCDHHHYQRSQLGDQFGKSEGIDEDGVKNLVVKSIHHLFYNSFKVKKFTFINFYQGTRNIRKSKTG